MEVLRRRAEIQNAVLPPDQEIEERWRQFGVLTAGLGTYVAVHQSLSRELLRNRPIVPQFFAIIPAMSIVYIGGLYVRMRTLQREGILS